MDYHRYHRLKVLLLSLGVVLGYGSAIAHFAWHRGHYGWHHACADMPWDAPHESAPKPNPTPQGAPRDGAR
jgi:hypothetical protein